MHIAFNQLTTGDNEPGGRIVTVKRILLAEDEKQLSMGITLALRSEGYEVTETNNGIDALHAILDSKIAGSPYDMLLCDIQMPKMTGEDLLEKLKKIQATLPTLVISGYGEKELIVRLLRAGCKDFIDKPFLPDDLCRKVNDLLSECSNDAMDAKRRLMLSIIGEKTVQVAHDLKNIISGTIGYADMALDEIEPDNPIKDKIEKLLISSGRAAEICRELVSKSKGTGKSFQISTEVNSLVQKIAAILSDIAPQNVTVIAEAPSDPIWLKADAERLQQAVLNLGFNAFNAMNNGGKLILSVTLDQVYRPCSNTKDQPCVIISVRDTGCGLSAEKKAKLFEESFSTREDGFGLGLGIVSQIVMKEHNGWINVESDVGKGTVFKLYFTKS